LFKLWLYLIHEVVHLFLT